MPLALAMIVVPMTLYVLAYSGLRLSGAIDVRSTSGVACGLSGCHYFTDRTVEIRPGLPEWIEEAFSPVIVTECALLH